MKKFTSNSFGQATIEYLFIMLFIVMLSVRMVGAFSDFMGNSMGSLGHVLTMSLSTGVCTEQCFFSGYKNGYSR